MIERPADLPVSMTPKVTWLRVEPADVLSGLKTLGPLQHQRRAIAYRGDNVNTLLSWAVDEFDLTEKALTDDERRKHATHAVSHAKRALDCLFDAYLERDFLDLRLSKRPAFTAKLELLKKRLGQQVPWRLIPAVVAEPRDVSEHERRAPSVEQTGIAVEAARVIATAMIATSDPLCGPALLGGFTGGVRGGPWGHHIYVTSFAKHFGGLWRCADGIPRAAAGTATASDAAEVIFADLSSFTEEEHLDALRFFDSFPLSSLADEATLLEKIRLAGLDQPK